MRPPLLASWLLRLLASAGDRRFTAVSPAAVFLPASLPANPDETRGDHELQVIGRLTPGATIAQARDGLARVDDDAARRFPATNRDLRTA